MSEDIDKKELKNKDAKAALELRRERARKNRALKNKGPLYVDPDCLEPGFHYRVVNDVDNGARVAQMEGLGYEIVAQADLQLGADGVNKPKSLGTNATRTVGEGITGILMRVPNEIYQDGLKDKEAEVTALSKAQLINRNGLLKGTLTQTKEK